MPIDFTEQIKSAVSMIDVCHQYGIPVDSGGFACCPFHGEKTGSLKIYPGQRGWYCFGCHKGGDVIDFVGQYFGLDFQKAMLKLNDDFLLGLPINAPMDSEQEKEARRIAYKRRKIKEHHEKVHMALQKAYDKALTDFAELDKDLGNVPSETNLSGLEAIEGPWLYNLVLNGMSDKTAYAMTHIDEAAYNLSKAQAQLFLFE